ncbi:MAG: serine/threonine-protein kinase [Phycisphaerales bacterium]|nr:serine/threonine-protein kinase [Phycisphaerales bacterium]
MSSERHARVSELFLAVRELTPERRTAFLDDACGDDSELRSEVEALLSFDPTRAVIDEPIAQRMDLERAQPGSRMPVSHPVRMGRYEILDVLGQGGMGTVYKARQSNPSRIVALKVIKAGLSSKTLMRRFEHECQVLGRLQHPGIAQIFEAGTDDAGQGPQPFFAMELVEGLRLTDYALEKRLGIRERLELFVKICDAVHHAHLKGIIHRDLKPANILVVGEGGLGDQGIRGREWTSSSFPRSLGPSDPFSAQPKILDFGVARATDSDLKTTTLQTDIGQLLGTVPYMSPEQVSGNPSELDIRSDVYALGVIGYELLTGRLPYDLHNKSIPDAVCIIRDEDPASLSSINKIFRGDIQTIIEKALEKEKDRRYESAAELGADVRRHLSDEPIVARRASAAYQLRKFAKRNRAFVSAVVMVFVTLLVALTITIHQRNEAEHERNEAVIAKEQAQKSQERALYEWKSAQAANRFLNTMLAFASPFGDTGLSGRNVTLLTVLNKAADDLDLALADEPDGKALVRMTIGASYHSLGYYDKAEYQFRHALEWNRQRYGIEHQITARNMRQLGKAVVRLGRYEEGIELLEDALYIHRSVFGDVDHRETAGMLSDFGWALRKVRDLERAESYLRESLEMYRNLVGEQNGSFASVLNNLATVVRARGKLGEAQELLEQSLATYRKLYGDSHPYIGNVENSLARLKEIQGDVEGAEASYVSAIEILRKTLGERHVMLATVMNNLASLRHDQNRLDEAEETYQESLSIYEKAVGKNHPSYISSLNNFGFLLRDKGAKEEAAAIFKTVGDWHRERNGERFWRTLLSDAYYAENLGKLGRFEEMEELILQSYERMKADYGTDEAKVSYVVSALVRFYTAWDKPEQVAKWEALKKDQ